MKCPTCKKLMTLRNGKYGEFYYCAQHGTINKRAMDQIMSISSASDEYAPMHIKDPLIDAIKRTGYAMGHHMDDMAQLIDAENDMEEAALDDDDHWMNVRPY